MCDFNRISGFIIAAQTSYLISIGIVAAAVVLGSNPFTSAANIPAMVIAAAAAGAAAIALAAAISELDRCTTGPCAPSVATLRTNLVALAASIGIYTVALAVLAVIAGVPFAGSVAAAAVLVGVVSLASLFTAIAVGYLGNATQAFNACLAASGGGNNGATTAIVVLGVLIILVTLVANGAGVANGTIPIPKWLGITS